MKTKHGVWLILLVALAGCKSLGSGTGEVAAAGAQAGEAATRGLASEEGAVMYEVQSGGPGAGGEVGPEAAEVLGQRTIYFDFDSARVRNEDLPLIRAHARYLAEHSRIHVTLEGHTDERGSREYNVALGEARARAVARLLEVNGVDSARIRILSYGEEKPVAVGHDEAAWQQNRRVEIVYGGS